MEDQTLLSLAMLIQNLQVILRIIKTTIVYVCVLSKLHAIVTTLLEAEYVAVDKLVKRQSGGKNKRKGSDTNKRSVLYCVVDRVLRRWKIIKHFTRG